MSIRTTWGNTPGEIDGLAAVCSLACHVHLLLGGDQRREAATHCCLVVGDEDADHSTRR
jgi:hypothetical protein